MNTIWSRETSGLDLVEHQFGSGDEDLAFRIRHRGIIIVRAVSRDEALALAAAIQGHYAETAQR